MRTLNNKTLNKREYDSELARTPTRAALCWDKAWEIRNFEIEMYWKRATYFWTFQGAIFAGYATTYASPKSSDSMIPYLLCLVGIVIGVAWFYANLGSKYWQDNWESHIDLLEDNITGPLNKVRFNEPGNPWFYSVTTIDKYICRFFIFIWVGLAVKFLIDNSLVTFIDFSINMFVAIATVVSLGFCVRIKYGARSAHFKQKNTATVRERTLS